MVDAWTDGISNFNGDLFGGSSSGIDLLTKTISNGNIVGADFSFNQDQAIQQISQALYGVLIPRAWASSNENVHPFILCVFLD